jgi:hypothetical protein
MLRISRRPKPYSTSCAREIGPYLSVGSTVTTELLETEPRSRPSAIPLTRHSGERTTSALSPAGPDPLRSVSRCSAAIP